MPAAPPPLKSEVSETSTAVDTPAVETPATEPPAATAAASSIDAPAVARFLTESGVRVHGPLTVELITGGRSNLTFDVSDGHDRWILRRPPLGHVLPTAHDMAREFTVLSALQDTEIPTPRTVALCTDPGVTGASFMMIEYVAGPIIDGAVAARSLDAQTGRRAAHSLVDVLARLHALDYDAIGLSSFGRPEGFMGRQITRWERQWSDSVSRPTPRMTELATLLRTAVPARGDSALVHGDYRLGNTILAADGSGRIGAVIDWEMSTLGDPLADLGLLLAYWDPASGTVTAGGHAVSANTGFPTGDDLAQRYAERSGRNLDRLSFYRAFGFFKLAAIAQTIVARYDRGLAVGDGLEAVRDAVTALIDAGLEQARA